MDNRLQPGSLSQPPAKKPPRPEPSVAQSLRTLAVAAVLCFTSYAQWQLALTLGYPGLLRAVLPVALGGYLVAALWSWGRSVPRHHADLIMAVVLGSTATAAGFLVPTQNLTTMQTAAVNGAVGTLLVVVAWRMHAIAQHSAVILSTAPQSQPESQAN